MENSQYSTVCLLTSILTIQIQCSTLFLQWQGSASKRHLEMSLFLHFRYLNAVVLWYHQQVWCWHGDLQSTALHNSLPEECVTHHSGGHWSIIMERKILLCYCCMITSDVRLIFLPRKVSSNINNPTTLFITNLRQAPAT